MLIPKSRSFFKNNLIIKLLLLKILIIAIIYYIQHDNRNNFNDIPIIYINQLTTSTKIIEIVEISPHIHFKPLFLVPNYEILNKDLPKIPHIIHQVWDTQNVPEHFHNWLKSWKIDNPKWDHIFWTLDDIQDLIKLHHPDMLSLYDAYISPIFRADAARYFILYHFGGFYLDLDMSSLKPLENWTYDYNFLISEEPYEHILIVKESLKINILNGFIACRPFHPTMELAIKSLPEAGLTHFGDFLHSTGPLFLNSVLLNYSKLLLEKKEIRLDSDITILPPKFFFPTHDKSESDIIAGKCHYLRVKSLSKLAQKLCHQMLLNGYRNIISQDAYTDHDWLHAYLFDDQWKYLRTKNIKDIIPHFISGKDALKTIKSHVNNFI